MLSTFPTSFSSNFKDSTSLFSQTTNDLLELARSKATSLFEPLSRYSSSSSDISYNSTTSSTSSNNNNADSSSSTTPLPLINVLVFSDTPPLRSSSFQNKQYTSRPKIQRRDTPAYISPREKGVKKVEFKAGGWVGVVEE